MDQLSDKPKEITGAGNSKTDGAFAQETFSEGVLTRNRTSSITKSPAVPRPRTRSLSGSSQSDIMTPESEKQSPGPASLLKRASAPAKPDQPANEVPTRGRRRRRTKAQIAADNAAKQALLELEGKKAGLPVAKKPGRPRGRPPKKIRTPVETPTSTVANSPTPSLQSEEPLPPLNVSNQESLESPSGDQETTKSSVDDFDVEDKVTALPPAVGVALLKEDELTFKEDTPLLKEDITPPPVAETKTTTNSSDDKNVMAVVEEQSKEECKENTAKTTELSSESEMVEHKDVPEGSSSQPVVFPNSVSAEDTQDGNPKEEHTEKPVDSSSEPMDVSPCKATTVEIPSEKSVQSSANTPAPDSVTKVKEASSDFPTDDDEMMDTESTAIATTAEQTSIQNSSAGSSTTATTLTNAEASFADSFLTTYAVSTVSSATTSTAMAVASMSSGASALKSSTKTVMSAAVVLSSALSSGASSSGVTKASTSTINTSSDTTTVTSSTTKTAATGILVSTQSSSTDTIVNSVKAKTIPSVVPLGSSMNNNNAKGKTVSNVSTSDTTTTVNTTLSTSSSNNVTTSSSATMSTNNVATSSSATTSTNNVATSSSATVSTSRSNHVTTSSSTTVSTNSTKDVMLPVVSLEHSSSSATAMNSSAKCVVTTVVPSTISSSGTTVCLARQSIPSTIPSVSLTTSTIPSVLLAASTIPSVSHATSTSPSVSLATSTIPSVSRATTTIPSVSLATSTIPSVSLATSTIPSVSLATSTIPSVSVATSTIPSVSLATSTIPSVLLAKSTNLVTGAVTVGSALSKICSQATIFHATTSSIAVTKPTSVTSSASIDAPRDVAKLDPLPINLNTSLSVTLPTLSSLLTTPSGQQKLVLPLEKLVLPPILETSATTTGAFISPPPVSKPVHSCSYVITSMQMKDTDPVSLAVSTIAQSTKENTLHSIASHQKVTSALPSSIISPMASLEPKKSEPTSVENKLREIAPKTSLSLEFHHLASDISRSSGVKKPELYEVLSNLKAVRPLVSAESKPSSFAASTTTIASIIGQSSSKEKSFEQGGSGPVLPTDKEQQYKPRPIAIKPDGMDLLRQIPAAVATSSRTYPNVHPLFPLPVSNKSGNLMTSFDLFRSVPTTKQFSTTGNISASVLPHLPGSSIAATYPPPKAPPPLISITDGPSQTVLGSVRVKVIDAPASAHQSSLSSLPAHMKVSRPRPISSQQSSISAPVVSTTLVSVTGSVPAPPTNSAVLQQQYIPHPLTIGVHASTSNKVPSSADVTAHTSASLSTSTTVAAAAKVKSEYDPAVTSHIPITSSVAELKSSLECPMCRHPVKNYKALCGHMKMHGGWDKSKFSSLDDYVCLYRTTMAAKAQEVAAQKRGHPAGTSAVATTSSAADTGLQPPPSKRHEGEPPQVFTFENNSKMSQDSMERRGFINHSAATLDDLCKAAETMRKMSGSHSAVNQPDYLKRRPENIVIPSQYFTSTSNAIVGGGDAHQRSPPYTPPPLLSPRPSIFTNTPLTPRSLYWPQRRSSEAPTVSESEESITYTEPKINVGEEYQAELGDCDATKEGVDQDNDFSELVFRPLGNLSRDDEDTLDGYFELACSPAVRLGGRNKEYAHHILHKLGGSVKGAVRVLLSGRSLVHKDAFMASYNYSGATKWSTKERQRFRRAWRDNHKNFRAIQNIVTTKNMRNVIEYYYTWKKYCMDEYKGRSRHYSMEEELSEDELETINGLTYNEAESYSDRPSNSSAANSRTSDHHHNEPGHSYSHPQIQSVLLTSSNSTKPSNDTSPRPDKPTFKCTYPGCAAAYSSIFALNGHIRIHGGRSCSFYPPRGEKKEQVKTEEHLDASGIPRDADAKSPRNQGARSGSSPKRAQAAGFSRAIPGTTSKAHKGKRISTTPHDQEGHYPCRLCGRVFDKVKSRSAHMKSHVVKPGGK